MIVLTVKVQITVLQAYGCNLCLCTVQGAVQCVVGIVQCCVESLEVILLEGQSVGVDCSGESSLSVHIRTDHGALINVKARHHEVEQVHRVVELEVEPVRVSVPVIGGVFIQCRKFLLECDALEVFYKSGDRCAAGIVSVEELRVHTDDICAVAAV